MNDDQTGVTDLADLIARARRVIQDRGARFFMSLLAEHRVDRLSGVPDHALLALCAEDIAAA